ncbi:MAG: hypothetical protein HQ565_07335 [Bacteroidetes bacterium]|nr:hypothetical protein [Bacteroidota bacterium]
MKASVKFIDHKGIRFISRLLQPDIIALGAITLLYSLIFWSVNKGVSIDEGYYLLGYLHDQQLGPSTTDFHRIVRTLFFFIPEDNVLIFRWTRVILTIVLLLLFLWSCYKWIEKQYKISFNKTLFYSMGILTGTMCFSYASPVIYYDNIQLLIYLLAFSLFFFSLQTASILWKYLSFFSLGIILVLGLTNYPPSGLLLLGLIFLLTGIYLYPSFTGMVKSCLIIFGGVIAGAVFYSLIIYDIRDFFNEALLAYTNAAKSPKAKYDADGQWLVIGKYFLGMAKFYLPVLGLSLVYILLSQKKLINRIILNIVFGLVLLVVTYKYSVYFSNILLLPIVLLLLDTTVNAIARKKRIHLSKNLILAIMLLALPLLAVAGSNQRLEMKMVYFMPFWFLALFVLYGEFRTYNEKSSFNVINYVFIIVFFIVFVAQGFLKHIHYNYSIKRSIYPIEGAVRFTNIGVSEYQQNFYENGIRELKKAGFEKGDDVLAFYKTFMLVYAAGGYVPHRLTYSAEFFVANKDNIPQNKVDYIIIDQGQIAMVTEFLEQSDWNFPESYNKVELGTDGHNLMQLGYNYILFSSK